MYNNISNEGLDHLKRMIKEATNEIRLYLNIKGFSESIRFSDEVLGFSFNFSSTVEVATRGSIGMLYEDNLGNPTFYFYVHKLFTENGITHEVKHNLSSGKSIEFYLKNLKTHVIEAVQYYEKITEDNLRESHNPLAE